MAMAAPIVLMVWKITSNLSSAIIILGIVFLMVFVASSDYKKFIVMGVGGVSLAAAFVIMVDKWQTPKLPASVLREFLPGCIPKSMSAIPVTRPCRHCMPSVPAASGARDWDRVCRS